MGRRRPGRLSPMSTATSQPTITPVWAPCAMCWGQGRIYQDRNGEGIVPSPCGWCLGVGECYG